MYSSCIFCHELLGTNDQIAHFPIGRRLAFDAAKGRLWVVCRRCSQWNLTPMEERWEAVEDCERAYRSVRTRVSTSEIGLARLADGLDLVRIGAPLRPEFAAWRYGDQFGVRQRRAVIAGVGFGGAAVAAGAGLFAFAGTFVAPVLLPVLGVGTAFTAIAVARYKETHAFSRPLGITADDGTSVALGSQEVVDVQMRADSAPEGFHLAMDVVEDEDIFAPQKNRVLRHLTVSGKDAVRAARLLLPRVNGFGATRRTVADAVQGIEDVGRVDRFIPHALSIVWKSGLGYSPIRAYPIAVRLGIEMALHEEAEQRAMEGELAELTAAWRQAEQIAGIADDLLLAPPVKVFLDKSRKR